VRVTRVVLSFGFSALVLLPCAAQQSVAPGTQASALLQSALAALNGGHSLSDATLSGTVQYIAGSADETGTAVLQTIAVGASSVNLSLPSGIRSEIQNCSNMPPVGAWSGPDGVSHAIAYHNLLTGPAWFFPAFTISQGLSASGYVATYVGAETHNGETVQHVSIAQSSIVPNSSGGLLVAHLTQVDLFLDSVTLLPSAIDFNIHPDNNAGLDIPVEIRLSNYTPVSGAQVAYHVQKYLNNGLVLDFQAQSVTLNKGLSLTNFSIGTGL
jgi:hypothetical protein